VPCGMLSSVALGFLGLCLYELLTCVHVGGLLVALKSGVVWKNGALYFMVYFMEMNDRSFGDRKRSLSFFSFSTLYMWTIAYISPLILSFRDFLVLFPSSS
jgi:hypothetical protein